MTSEDDNIFDTKIPILSHLTYAEWHAFVNGLYCSLTQAGPNKNKKDHKEYWRGGYLIGWAIKIIVILALGEKFLPIAL